jgi:hypothetical protein
VAKGFEPSHGRNNNAVPYQLGYATKDKDERSTMNDERRCFTSSFIVHGSSFRLEAMKGVESLSSGLQDRRSVIRMSYIAI